MFALSLIEAMIKMLARRSAQSSKDSELRAHDEANNPVRLALFELHSLALVALVPLGARLEIEMIIGLDSAMKSRARRSKPVAVVNLSH